MAYSVIEELKEIWSFYWFIGSLVENNVSKMSNACLKLISAYDFSVIKVFAFSYVIMIQSLAGDHKNTNTKGCNISVW